MSHNRAVGGAVLRVEVPDARGDEGPPAVPAAPSGEEESGRGPLLFTALADRRGVDDRVPGPAPGKTVRAELDLR